MRKHIFCSTWNLHLEALEPVGRECDECSPFIWTESSDRSLTKLYGNGFFLSMLSSKHFQTNSSGLPSLCVTAKRILSLCSIFCLSRFIFLRSPSCNFTQADCLECMAQTVAFHWWGCNVRSGLSCYPAQNLDDTPGPQEVTISREESYISGSNVSTSKQRERWKKCEKNPTFPPIVRIIWELLLW